MRRNLRVLFLLLVIMVLTACYNMPGEPPITAPTLSALNESLSAPDQPLAKIPEEFPLESTLVPEPATQSQAIDTPITLWHSFSDDRAQALFEAVANYQENQSVRVKLVYMPFDDLLESYRLAALSEDGPDLMIAPGEWGDNLFEEGLILDLSEYASDELITRLNPVTLEIIKHNDAVVGIPFTIRGVVMYRNASILPVAPTDIDQLINMTRDATHGRFIGSYLDLGDVFSAAHLSACGGTWIDERGYPNFNNETGLCWFEILKTFQNAGPVAIDSEDDFERFASGNIGLIVDGTWKLDKLVDSLGNNLVIDPWPSYREKHLSGFVWADCIYMNPTISKQSQVNAWSLMEFLPGQQTQIMLPEHGLIPTTIDSQIAIPHIQQVIQAISMGTMYPSRKEIEFFWEPLNHAIRSVFEEGVDPATALQAARNQIVVEIVENR